MPFLKRRLAGLCAMLLVVGCEGRDRTNPLDPQNDLTAGRPDWLRAVADHRSVELEWRSAPPRGFRAWEIFRSAGDAPDFELLSRRTDWQETSYRDTGLVNGRVLRYRLDLVFEDGAALALPEKEATPGAAVVWVLENASLGLVRCAPDARQVRSRSGSYGLLMDLQAAPDGSAVWAVDYYLGELVRFDAAGARIMSVPIPGPYRLAVSHVDSIVWVGTWSGGSISEVVAFDFAGRELSRFLLDVGLRDLAVHPLDGACFVAGGPGGGIRRLALGQAPLEGADGDTILMVAVAAGGVVWGGNPVGGGIHSYDLETLSLLAAGDRELVPQCFAADRNGYLWVVSADDRILVIDGGVNVRLEWPGLGPTSAIGVEPETGVLWLAQPSASRVVRFDPRDESSRALPLYQPFNLAIGIQR